MSKKQQEFWVINLTKQDLRLQDLNYTLRANTQVNLLDKKHFSYTIEQLEQSKATGSLFLKKDKVKLAGVMFILKKPVKEAYKQSWPNRKRIAAAVDNTQYEDIPLFEDGPFASEEKFADEFSETLNKDVKIGSRR